MIELCPNCGGQKTVSKPPWVAGDVHTWDSTDAAALYPCPTCDGKGYIEVNE